MESSVRRRALPAASARRAAALVAALLAAFPLLSCDAQRQPASPNIILFIGDGMGYSSELVASRYLYGRDDGLAWRGFPLQAWAATWNIDCYDAHAKAAGRTAYAETYYDPRLGYDPKVAGEEPWPLSGRPDALAYLTAAATDSAAAATALATGRKTKSGYIAWSAELSPLRTLPERMRSLLGSRFGVVTSVPFDHATPASFAAHDPSRGSYAAIAEQMTRSSPPDLIVGGGHPAWCSSYYGAADLARLRASGSWSLAERAAGEDGAASLAAAAADAARPLFGLFGGSDGAFEAPIPANAPGSPSFSANAENPSLAAAALIAARRLSGGEGGFFLMVEQGDIDWANHQNDLGRMIGALASLDTAVRAIEAWVDEPGDGVDWGNTILVVTADHATGLPRFSGPSSLMPRGELPTRITGAAPHAYAYASGLHLSYATTGHGNELVTLAVRGDRAWRLFSAYIGSGGLGPKALDDTDIYKALKAFAGL